MIRQELNPVTCKLDGKQIHLRCRHGQWMLPSLMHSFVGQSSIRELCPPALVLERERTEGRKREKFYIDLDVTHTPPAGAGSTLKGKRKKKANTDDGQKARTEQGGEGNKRTSKTNLHGETDLTKTAHTPKPHDTLRRGTRGKLGTKWGTSWWQTKKQNN